MRESFLKLKDRSVVLTGPFGPTAQAIMTVMTEQGADVAYVDKEAGKARRFADNLNDSREVHPHYGQSIVLEQDIQDKELTADIPGRVAEVFGSVDILIDANPLKLFFESDRNKLVQSTFELSQSMLTFLEGRKKGRILFLAFSPQLRRQCAENEEAFQAHSEIQQYLQTKATSFGSHQITMNMLELGLTEYYLLEEFPDCPTLTEAEHSMQKIFPQIKLTAPLDIANVVAFICSSNSNAINAQTISLLRCHALIGSESASS